MKRNAVYKILFFIISMFVSLLMIPLVMEKLGVDSYGFIVMINTLMLYLSLVTTSITSALGKNLIRSGSEEAEKQFISTFILMLIFLTLIITLSLIVIHFFVGVEGERKYLIFCALLSFFLNAITATFNSILYSRNRLDYLSVSIFFQQSFAAIVLLSISIFIDIKLIHYGFGLLFASSSSFLITFVFLMKIKWRISTKLKNIDFVIIKANAKESSWIVLNQIGVVFLLQFNTSAVAYYEGLNVVGYFSIGMLFYFQIRNVLSMLFSIFEAKLVDKILNHNNANRYYSNLTYFVVYTSFFISSFYLVNSKLILEIWLGKSYDEMIYTISSFIVASIPFSIIGMCAWPVFLAKGRSDTASQLTLWSGLFHVLLALLLYKHTSLGVYAFIVSFITSMTLKNFIFTLYLIGRLGFDYIRDFIITIHYGIGTLVFFYISYYFEIKWYMLIVLNLILILQLLTIKKNLFKNFEILAR